MLTEIPSQDFSAVVPLFAGLADHLAVSAVLQGGAAGRIYVDDPHSPTSALLHIRHRCYLAGYAPGVVFGGQLADLLARAVFPAARASGQNWLSFYYPDARWERWLHEIVLPGQPLYPGPRQVYRRDLCQASSGTPPLPTLPEGFDLWETGPELLSIPGLNGREELVEEMLSERESVADFLARSFGVCLVHQGAVVTWCLSEYNQDGRCEVGIATAEAYRRRGLARITGHAFLALAYRSGITQIGWHCWTSNHGSVATALALGFEKQADYSSAFSPVP